MCECVIVRLCECVIVWVCDCVIVWLWLCDCVSDVAAPARPSLGRTSRPWGRQWRTSQSEPVMQEKGSHSPLTVSTPWDWPWRPWCSGWSSTPTTWRASSRSGRRTISVRRRRLRTFCTSCCPSEWEPTVKTGGDKSFCFRSVCTQLVSGQTVIADSFSSATIYFRNLQTVTDNSNFNRNQRLQVIYYYLFLVRRPLNWIQRQFFFQIDGDSQLLCWRLNVILSDIVGFTAMAAESSPMQVRSKVLSWATPGGRTQRKTKYEGFPHIPHNIIECFHLDFIFILKVNMGIVKKRFLNRFLMILQSDESW